MRAMWFEFPQAEHMTHLETQFMFGAGLLVCPKLVTPKNDDNVWSVDCVLPNDS